MLVKTSELSGMALDWVVAQCEGHEVKFECNLLFFSDELQMLDYGIVYHPSKDWEYGGPIIEREGISLKYEADPYQKWTATWRKIEYKVVRHHTTIVKGPKVEMSAPLGSPLVAAMRCYVASKLGDEVEIPEEVCDASL